MKNTVKFLVVLQSFLLAACVTVPEPLRGDFAVLSPAYVRDAQLSDLWVRWGGSISSVETGQDWTCMNIVARPLSSSARPQAVDVSLGRFRACSSRYFEPEVFRPGRAVTIIGYVNGSWQGLVGQYTYDYPLVEADVVFLWPPYRVYARPYYARGYYRYPYYYGVHLRYW